MKQGERERYRIGELILDVPAASLQLGKEPVEISGLTFDLLVFLVRRAPDVVTHDCLLEHIWAGAHVGEETLKQRVRLLRKTLGEDSKNPTYIRTVRGKGYQLIAPVTPLIEEKPGRRAALLSPRLILPVLIPLLMLTWWGFKYAASESKAAPTTLVRDSLSAEELYERGSEYYHRYLPEDNQKAIGLLQQAITARDDYYQAHALLSRAYSQQPKLGNGYWGEEARAAAERAVELAPNRVEGYLALGIYHDVAGMPGKGIQAYQKALTLDEDNGIAWSNSAYNFLLMGRLDEALVRNIKGMELNPEGQFGMVQMAEILRLLGLADKAETWFVKAKTLQPDNVFNLTGYARFLLLEGRTAEALDQLGDKHGTAWGSPPVADSRGDIFFFTGELEKAEQSYRQSWQEEKLYGGFRLVLVLKKLGRAEGDALSAKIESRLRKAITGGYEYADFRLYLAMLVLADKRELEALTWLEAAGAAGWTDAPWLLADPALQPLQEHTRFKELIAGIQDRVTARRNKVLDENRVP
ncbi:MAG: winged helix-turn-helix domain-containing protein [Acidobacteriota bacterium]|nr:winged helix-turn-helix domain-containing protein [Acidobacteriota bacterium]